MDRKCPHCNSPVPEEAGFCMHCMKYTAKQLEAPIIKTERKNKAVIAALTVFGIAVIAVAAFFIAGNSTNPPVTPSEPAETGTFAAEETASDAPTSETETKKRKKKPAQTTTEQQTEETQSETETETETEAPTVQTTVAVPSTEKASEKKEKKTEKKKPKPVISNGVLKSYPAELESSSYKIPYSVKKISRGALKNKNLKEITFSSRENVDCDWADFFSGLPNLKKIYIYPGTSVDIEGKEYFNGKIVYM